MVSRFPLHFQASKLHMASITSGPLFEFAVLVGNVEDMVDEDASAN